MTALICLMSAFHFYFKPLQLIHTNRDRGRDKIKVQYHVQNFTLVRNGDRDHDLLIPILPVPFPVLVVVPFGNWDYWISELIWQILKNSQQECSSAPYHATSDLLTILL